MSQLLSVEEALAHILKDAPTLGAEDLVLRDCGGRVLAADIAALRTQPPFAASAMDGYATRSADLASFPTNLTCIGESAAGHGYRGGLSEGECIRIFTGAPVPPDADTIIIQENAAREGNTVIVQKGEQKGRYIRPAGLDFHEGDVLLKKGTVLDAASLSLAASMNHPTLPIIRRPKVAIIASGDELRMPGEELGPDDIICSNNFGVREIVLKAGGAPLDLGIARDTLEDLSEKLALSADADIIITLGGASVGEHDLVHKALTAHGVDMSFWKLAMRPGKPVMFGRRGHQRFIGLPGNPVSSLVGAQILVAPLIKQLAGLLNDQSKMNGILAVPVPANDQREEYMRATLHVIDGTAHVTPFENQDSSILSSLAKADCLMIRPAHAPAYAVGDACEIILI